ncbi:MAG TPA: hypothetical protein CFH82_03255 [Sulfurospirillum sp. UBA12182]|jgi:uncharacterized membrane protein YkoI|nr:MAG TPA: hypothetical protein CFH82_03255 [Sulfurospirillum sp. UBA12182]
MKNNSYFVKGIVALGLISSVALASDNDLELNDDNGKDRVVKSSIQVKDDISELEEKRLAKIDVNEVVNIIDDKYDGKITHIELGNEDGNLVYEAEILTKNDIVKDIVIDAGNGQILLEKEDEEDSVWSEFKEYLN